MSSPARHVRLAFLLLCFTLAGCAGQAARPQAQPTLQPAAHTPWVFKTPTLLPTLQPTLTPPAVRTPTAAGLAVPRGGEMLVIPTVPAGALQVMGGAADPARLEELARWGNGSILHLDYTPDGTQLVLATRRGIAICSAETLSEQRFVEVPGGVPMVSVSPDGKLLAASSWTSSLALYDLQNLALVRTLDNGDHGAPLALRWLEDGRTVSLATTGEIHLMWDAPTGKLVHRWYTTGNSAAAASPSGSLLATADWSGNIFLWNGEDGRSPARLWGRSEVQEVLFSPQEGVIAAGYGDGKAGVWQVEGSRLRFTVSHTDRVSALAFSADGEVLATGSWDNSVGLWRATDGTPLQRLSGMRGRVVQVLFSPDGSRLAVVAGDGLLRVWRAADGQLLAQTPAYMGLRQAVFAYEGLIAAADDGSVQFWSPESGARRELPDAQPGGIASLVVSADGRWMAAGAIEGSLKVWSLPEQALAAQFSLESGWISSLALAEDGSLLAAAGQGGAQLWRLPQGQQAARIETDDDTLLSMAFLHAAPLLAGGGIEGSLRLWRTDTGELVRTLRGDGRFISALEPLREGTALVSGGEEDRLSLWSVYQAELTGSLAGEKGGRLSALAVSPDGQWLAAGWWGGYVTLYNLVSGQLLRSLRFEDTVRRAAFSGDGSLLALSLEDGTVRVWGIKN